MPSYKLLCPSCSGHFDLLLDSGQPPANIECPHCTETHIFNDYSVLLKCPNCNVNLEVPMEVLSRKELCCPQCHRNFSALSAQNLMNAFDSTADSLYKVETEKKTLLQNNDFFDKYRIIRLLGKGGMAEVYLAEHVLLKQKCALKIMKQSSFGNSNILSIKRFIREAKLSHAIDHPNITKVYDVGNDHKTGFFFIAMEYIDGKTLLQLSKEQKFSEEDLITVGIEMSQALIELGKKNVVHRDIKPSNIMLDSEGNLKLMDLGIAKTESREHGEMTLTMEQAAIGTPNYASPEQCRSAHEVDARADIYCLGSTLYHLASGKLPFEGDTVMEIILKVIQTEPEPLAKLCPALSRHMIELIEKMMKKDPNQRPQNAEELLALFMKQKSSFSDFLSRLVPRWIKTKTFWKYAGVLLLLAAAALQFVFYSRPEPETKTIVKYVTLPAARKTLSQQKAVQKQQNSPAAIVPLKQKTQQSSTDKKKNKPSATEKHTFHANKAASAAESCRSKTGPLKTFENTVSQLGKPSLPANGIRTMKYRIALAEWKLDKMIHSKDYWYLKPEQIIFYQNLINRLKRCEKSKQYILKKQIPKMSSEERIFFQNAISSGKPIIISKLSKDMEKRISVFRYFDNKITIPDGKDYSLLARFAAGQLRILPHLTRFFYMTDPDADFITGEMKKNIHKRTTDTSLFAMSYIIIPQMLHNGREDIDHFDSEWSWLEYAVYLNIRIPQWNKINTFLAMECDPNPVFSNGITLLHAAAEYSGSQEIVKNMYFLGFDKWNLKNRHGETAYQLAVRHANQQVIDFLHKLPCVDKTTEKKDRLQYQLHQAVVQGEVPKIEQSLSAGAIPDFRYGNRKMLTYIAAERDQLEAFKFLEKNPNLRSKTTPYMILAVCVTKKSKSIMEYVLKNYNHMGINNLLQCQYYHSSLPNHILVRYGIKEPNVAISMLELCGKYGWKISSTWKNESELANLWKINMHPDVVTYLNSLGIKKSPQQQIQTMQKTAQTSNPAKNVDSLKYNKLIFSDDFSVSNHFAKKWTIGGQNKPKITLKNQRVTLNDKQEMSIKMHLNGKSIAVLAKLTPEKEPNGKYTHCGLQIDGITVYFHERGLLVAAGSNQAIGPVVRIPDFTIGKTYRLCVIRLQTGDQNKYIIKLDDKQMASFQAKIMQTKTVTFYAYHARMIIDNVAVYSVVENSSNQEAINPNSNTNQTSHMFSDLIYKGKINNNGHLELDGDYKSFQHKNEFIPPYTIKMTCRLVAQNLSLALSGGHLNFNTTFRQDKIKVEKQHLRYHFAHTLKEPIPKDKWIDISIQVTKTELSVYVDKKCILKATGNFEPSKIAMSTSRSKEFIIKSFSISK